MVTPMAFSSSGSGPRLRMDLCRIRTSPKDAWKRKTGSNVHRWSETPLSHSRQDEEEGVGKHGEATD